MQNPKIQLQSGECFSAPLKNKSLSNEIKQALTKANEDLKNDGHAKYIKKIEQIFGLDPITEIPTERKSFLAGFFEGEGSINVSVKKLKNARFGLIVDPEFSITQHVNGVGQLQAYLYLFQTGRIRYKSGSNATLVYIIDNRKSLEEKFIPFWKKYVEPWSTPTKSERVANFLAVLNLIKANKHQDIDTFCDQILPLWDKMRMQKGQSNESFETLQDAQDYARNFIKLKS